MEKTILFVCTGNTCRSPLAAGIYAAQNPEDNVLSAGLSAAEGMPASAHMLAVAPEYGADLGPHRSRQLTPELLEQADYIVCLSASHAKHLVSYLSLDRAQRSGEKLRVLAGGIPDPYGGNLEAYRACGLRIAAALPALRRELRAAPGLQIVPMEEAHIPAAAALERACFALPWSEQALREGMQAEGAHYLAALDQGHFIGYLGISHAADQTDIANIAVEPAGRRRGVAQALLARAETRAVLEGCAEIRLECRAGNAAALALYRSRGYAEVGRRKKYYQNPDEDAILLTLFIY